MAAEVLARARGRALGCRQKAAVRATDVDGALRIAEGEGVAARVRVENATTMTRDGASWEEACHACAAAVDGDDEAVAVGAREAAMTIAAVAWGVVVVVAVEVVGDVVEAVT